MIRRRRRALITQMCEWFTLCFNEATTTRSHPILGDVPICQRCQDKMDRLASNRN